VTLDANKALIRRLFEEVLPAGDPVAARDLFAPEFFDRDPLPGQPAGAEGIAYVVSTLHAAWRDPRFSVDDLVAEADRVAIRWTLRGISIGPMFGRPPSGGPAEQAAIALFRIAGGKIVERWAGFSPAGKAMRQAAPPR
jgi:predicted ester cyclase